MLKIPFSIFSDTKEGRFHTEKSGCKFACLATYTPLMSREYCFCYLKFQFVKTIEDVGFHVFPIFAPFPIRRFHREK